jgi:hypothetical protein
MMSDDRHEQLGSGDLITLVSDVGPVPMNVGAILFVAGEGDVDAATVEATFTRRLTSIRRLQQRLATPRRGLGRPYWVDDSDFDVHAHVSRVRCPCPGERDAALAIAVDAVTRPLPRSRPLWRAVVVTGLTGGHIGLVLVLHHVVADGIGGLAVLARVVDGADAAGPAEIPRHRLGAGSSTALPTVPGRCADFRARCLVYEMVGPNSVVVASDGRRGVPSTFPPVPVAR